MNVRAFNLRGNDLHQGRKWARFLFCSGDLLFFDRVCSGDLLFFDRVIGKAGFRFVQGVALMIGQTKRRCRRRRDVSFAIFAFVVYKGDVVI